jgi:Protein of unknown function (DUF3102)
MAGDPRQSNSLTDLAARINAAHESVQAAMRRTLEHAMAAGDLLREARQQLKHGRWLPWLAENCSIPARTATLYMRLAANRSTIEQTGNVADLTIRGALEALSAALPLHGERELFGVGLFADGESLRAPGVLAEEHLAPPFSVLDGTQGWWQRRGGAWRGLGIQPELGEAARAAAFSEALAIIAASVPDLPRLIKLLEDSGELPLADALRGVCDF